jgi:heptosyltransferase-3
LPAFHVVRNKFLDASITLLTNEPVNEKAAPVESILENTGLIDDVIKYPLRLRRWKGVASLWKTLTRRRFEAVVYMTQPRGRWSSVRDYLFFKACGFPKVLGVPFRNKYLKSLPIRDTGMHQWEAERLLASISLNGTTTAEDDSGWDLRLTKGEIGQGTSLLQQAGIRSRFIAVGPGTKVDAKDWTEPNWNALLSILTRLYPNFGLVLVGSADERARADRLVNVWHGPHLNVCGECSPRVSAAIISKAKLFIGHDSGPMHLAGAVGTPSVAIFSARNPPGQWYPRGSNNTILYHKTFCYGCRLDECRKYDKWCIRSITVQEVVDAASKYLANAK